MAQEEIVKILKIETGDSQQTVKGLREEIKDLRDNILNLTEGTEDYEKAVNKLQGDQKKLDQVMSLTKKTAGALDGSYDALTQKMSLLKKEWRATNDEAKRDELGKQIANINDQLKEMDATVGNFQRNVGNYTESIIDAFEQMNHSVDEWKNKAADAWEKGDIEEYTKAIREAGKAQAKVERIEQDLEASTPSLEKQFQGLTDTAAGLAGGFEVIQSIMILTGRDTEDFEKVMIKVQTTMALVQGIQGIGGLAKGFKMLGTTIRSVGNTIVATSRQITAKGGIIGILLAAAGALAGYIIKMSQAKEEAAEYARYINSAAYAQEQLNTATENANGKISHQIELMKLQGRSNKDILLFQKEQLQKQIEAQQKVVDKAKKERDDIHTDRFLGIGHGKWNKKYTEEDENAANEQLNISKDAMKELTDQMEIINAGLEEIKRQEKENAADIKKNAEDYFKSEEQLLTEHYQRDLQILIDAGEDTKALTNKYYAELAEIREKNKKEEVKKAPTLEEMTDSLYNDVVNTEIEDEELPEDLMENPFKFEDQEIEMKKKAVEIKEDLLRIEIENERRAAEEAEKIQQARVDTFQASASAISSILAGMASLYQQDIDEQLAAGKITDEMYKEQFKKVKAIQIAEATVNTIAGAIGAFMSASKTIPAPYGMIVGGIQAAAISATGAMQIAQISKTQPGTGNERPPMVQPPTNAFAMEEPQATRNVTGYKETEELNQAQRVYILESDLQESAKRVQVRESESSF